MDPILVYAAVRLLLALLFLLLQLAVLPLFFIYTEYRRSVCYRIMLAIGLVDICQLVANGLFILFGLLDIEYSRDFEKWAGAVNASTWDVLFVLQMLLALNRLSVVLKNSFLITVKKQELPWERRLFNVLLLLTLALCLAIMAIFASPYCSLYFNKEEFYWGYVRNYPWTTTVRDIEFRTTGFLPLATFIAYVLIVCLLKWRRAPLDKSQNGTAGGKAGGEKHRLLSVQEKRILLQSGAQFLLLSLLMLLSYFLPSTLDMVSMINVGSIVVCGINPVLYLVMNGPFRHRFLAMFRCEGEHTERMFIVSQALQTRRESRTRRVSQVRPADFALVQQQYYARKMKRPMTMPSIVS